MKKPDVPYFDPDVDHLASLIDEIARPGRLAELQASLEADRERLSWEKTKHDFLALVEGRL